MSKFWSTGSSNNSSSSSKDDDDDEANEERQQHNNEQEVITSEGEKGIDDSMMMMTLDPNYAWDKIKEKQKFVTPLQSTNEKPEDCIRIVCISDTHSKHRELFLPSGDILVHGGDFTKSGEPGTVQDLDQFFDDMSSRYKDIICIAGNHDLTFHPEFYVENWQRFHRKQFDCINSINNENRHASSDDIKSKQQQQQQPLENCTYLEDSSKTTTVGGLHVYGSPWSPTFFDWAFNLDRGEPIRKVWEQIPATTDILITHGPPLGRGDQTSNGNGRAGCFDLLVEVQNRILPRVHIFGHIHEDAGVTFDGNTLYVNASNLDIRYQVINHPVVIDVPIDLTKPAMIVPPICKVDAESFCGWCRDSGFESISINLEDLDVADLPSENDLLGQDAFDELTNKLNLHRDRGALKELRKVQAKLYAESFPSV